MPLDLEQQQVVDAPVDGNLLVEAGPGRGKTHVLAERISRLIRDGECEAGEILVLSFSRAARDELARRLAAMSEDTYVGAVTIRTLDSLATQIQIAALGMAKGAFDDRIRDATDTVKDDAETSGVTHYRHVLVDEAQDIVGVRATFLMALWEFMADAGFTVFADQAQAIYDFCLVRQEHGPAIKDTTTSREMLRCFMARARPRAAESIRLVNYYRSSDASLRALCTEVWTQLSDEQYAQAKSAIDSSLVGLMAKGTLADVTWGPNRSGKTRAVLCPQNGQALYAATEAFKAGARVRIQRSERHGEPPVWVGRLLLGCELSMPISLEYLRSLDPGLLPEGMSAELIHQSLRITCRSGGDDPKVRQVVHAVSIGAPFERFTEPDLSDAVVYSTIHRAKGREFDEVAYLDWEAWEEEPSPGYDQRVRFVGLSRAKSRNCKLRVAGPQMFKNVAYDRAMGFVGSGPGRKIFGMQVGLPGDLDPFSFVRAADVDGVRVMQEQLCRLAQPGTVVRLVKGPPSDYNHLPIYSLVTGDGTKKLGEANLWFAKHLREAVEELQGKKRDPWPYPRAIENLWVRGLYTTLPPAQADRPPEGIPPKVMEGRLWVMPEIEGLGNFAW